MYKRQLDTLELCQLIGISKEEYIEKFNKAKSYSPYKASLFEKQLSVETYATLQEKLYKFPGFYVEARTLRKYPLPICLLYTSPSPRDRTSSRMPSSA